MIPTEHVNELIAELDNNRNENGELLSSVWLSERLLEALGALGYTVSGDVADNVFKCGLCGARDVLGGEND